MSRYRLGFLFILLSLLIPAISGYCEQLDFKEYSDYFVKNTFKPQKPVDFQIIRTDKEFSKIYKAVPPVTGKKLRYISKDEFSRNFMVSILKQGNNFWEMSVKRAVIKGKELSIYYTADCTRKKMSWVANCFVLVSIEKASFNTVKFYENNKLIKTLKIK